MSKIVKKQHLNLKKNDLLFVQIDGTEEAVFRTRDSLNKIHAHGGIVVANFPFTLKKISVKGLKTLQINCTADTNFSLTRTVSLTGENGDAVNCLKLSKQFSDTIRGQIARLEKKR